MLPTFAAICPRCRDFPFKIMGKTSAAFCPKGLQNCCCRMRGIRPTCRDDWVAIMSSQNGAADCNVTVAKGSFLRSTSLDTRPALKPEAPYGEAAVTSAESGVC